jgi:hypothetical protein
MQSGLIQVQENQGPYNFYKRYFNNAVVDYYYTRKGSNKDLISQLQVNEDYGKYRTGKSARRRFLKGDLESFSDMISTRTPFRTKDINVLRGLIDSKERLLLNLNDTSFTLTKQNLMKGGKMYKSLKNFTTSYFINSWGSDKVKQEVIKGITSGSLSRVERPVAKKIRRNRNAGQFKYINTTDIDLTKYQIIKDETELDFVNEHCLIQTLLHCGISEDVCNRIKLSFNYAYEFPRSKLSDVAKIIEHQIVLYFVKDNKSSNRKVINNQIYGKFDKQIKIAMYDEHYFVYEDVNYSIFSIKHYNDVKELKDWNLITKLKVNGSYVREAERFHPINSLELIYNLNLGGHFVESNILKSIDTRQTKIYLNEISKEQNEFEHQESKFIKVPVVFYADTETDVSGENHMLLYFGIIDDKDEEPFIFTDAYENNFFTYINTKLNKLPKLKYGEGMYCPIVYFHNVKYDFTVIRELFNIESMCEKDSALYSFRVSNKTELKYISNNIEIVDSYKMIPIPLSKFSNTFSLGDDMNKKEAIAYTYYTSETKYQTLETIDNYMAHLNPKLKDTFMDNLNNKLFEFNEENQTFNPYAYYLYYLKYDVLVLRGGMHVLKIKMNDLTGLNINNILTISSLVDRSFKNQDCYKGVYSLKGNIREFVGSAIYGGRVAVNQQFILQEINEVINDYDCTSLYPSSLSRLAKEMGIPTGSAKILTSTEYNNIKNFIYYIVKIKIIKINKSQQIPFIGVKVNGILQYINDACDGIEMTVDKITLEDYIEFHHIEFEIIEGVYWNEGSNKTIGTVIDTLFADRIKYKQLMKGYKATDNEYKSGDIMQNLIKLMLNSVYGKTIMKKTNTTSVIKSNGEELQTYIYNEYKKINTITKLNSRQSIVENKSVDDSSNLAHVGCLILSYSKRIMNEVMNVANDNNIVIYYQDTDSMHLKNADISKLEQCYKLKYNTEIRGEAMAKFHSDFSLKGAKKGAEIIATTSIFLGKKCYMDILQSVNDNNEIIQDVHIKLKGITEAGVNHKINYYMKEQKMNKVDAVKYMFNQMIKGEKMAFILNPKNEKVMFKYHSNGVSTCDEQIRILDYSDDCELLY